MLRDIFPAQDDIGVTRPAWNALAGSILDYYP
jgi:hypothetical protein